MMKRSIQMGLAFAAMCCAPAVWAQSPVKPAAREGLMQVSAATLEAALRAAPRGARLCLTQSASLPALTLPAGVSLSGDEGVGLRLAPGYRLTLGSGASLPAAWVKQARPVAVRVSVDGTRTWADRLTTLLRGARAGDRITLLADVSSEVPLPLPTCPLTLDLAGHPLPPAFATCGNLTLTSTPRTAAAPKVAAATATVSPAPATDVPPPMFRAPSNPLVIGSTGYYSMADALKAAKKGDVIRVIDEYIGRDNPNYADEPDVVITFSEGKHITIDLNGNPIYSRFVVEDGAEITVTNGTLQLDKANAGENEPHWTLKGGTVTFRGVTLKAGDSVAVDASQATSGLVVVESGHFEGTGEALFRGAPERFALRGGTYDRDVGAFCDAGYACEQDADGVWHVVAKAVDYVAEAMVDGEKRQFETLEGIPAGATEVRILKAEAVKGAAIQALTKGTVKAEGEAAYALASLLGGAFTVEKKGTLTYAYDFGVAGLTIVSDEAQGKRVRVTVALREHGKALTKARTLSGATLTLETADKKALTSVENPTFDATGRLTLSCAFTEESFPRGVTQLTVKVTAR